MIFKHLSGIPNVVLLVRPMLSTINPCTVDAGICHLKLNMNIIFFTVHDVLIIIF